MNLWELLLVTALYANGFLSTSLVLKKENPFFIASMALFSGVALSFFLFFPVLLIFGKINVLTMETIFSLLFFFLFCLNMKKSSHRLKNCSYLFASLAVFLGLYLFLFNYDFNLFCGDTFYLTQCAQKFSTHPVLFASNFKSLSSWGGVFVLLQHMGYEVGLSYFSSLQVLLYMSFLGSFFFLLLEALKAFEVQPRLSLLASGITTLILATSPIFLHVVLLLHTNAYLIYYFFLFLVFFWIGNLKKKTNYIYLSYVFLFISAFTRVEAPIYCISLLLCILFGFESRNVNKKKRERVDRKMDLFDPLLFKVTILFCAVMGGWYVFLYFIGVDSDILSKDRALFLIGLYSLIPVALISLNYKILKFIKIHFFRLTYLFIFLALISVGSVFYNHILQSLKGISHNIFNRFWVGPLIFMGGTLFIIMFKKRVGFLLEKSILTALFLIVLCIVSFSLFRKPFYGSLYDSSNRLFVTLVPILFFYLTLKLCASKAFSFLKLGQKIT